MKVRRLPSPPIVRHMLEAQQRERQQITVELAKVKGLMPLLMKRRNGGRWTVDERHQLIEQLHAFAHLSPYLVVLVMPGSFIALPVLAWWLDRRRYRRAGIPRRDAVPPAPTFDETAPAAATNPDTRT
jgi:hypothetical protein